MVTPFRDVTKNVPAPSDGSRLQEPKGAGCPGSEGGGGGLAGRGRGVSRLHGGPSGGSRRGSLAHRLAMAVGSFVLRVCPQKLHSCSNTRCHLRAFCACAQEDLKASWMVERRVWLTLAGCSLLVLGFWMAYGLAPMLK